MRYSPWPFVTISFIAFIVALAFEIRAWISDEEKKRIKQYEDKCSEVEKAEQEYKTLKREIESINEEVTAECGLAMQKHEYACGNEKRLVSLAHQVISVYESTNADCRKDRQCPQFFGQKPDFRFTFYFNKIFNTKLQSNEKNNGNYNAVPDELVSE